MNAMNEERRRAFKRWLALGPKSREAQASYAMRLFLPALEVVGFKWVEKGFDGVNAQVNAIELERENVQGQIDFISIIFDKYRSPRFQIALGTKEKLVPHKWVRGGRIVRRKSGLDKHNWWGAKWWHLNKGVRFAFAVNEVFAILPQAVDFLSNGTVGPNIWESKIESP